MARARNIKPGFFTNEVLAELSFESRLLFIGLWTIADRAGRFNDRPKRIKMQLFPADSVDVDGLLSDLAKSGFIWRYEVDGERYCQIVNWDKHQNPHKHEAESEIPAPVDRRKPAPAQEIDDSTSKHGSSTAIGGSGTDIVGSRPADSLIPDSLIPDSLIASSDKRKRASALPASFEPKESHHDLASSLKVSLKAEWLKFKDHHQAKGSTFSNWDAALNTWLRKAAEFQQARASPPYQTAADKRISFAEALTGQNRERTAPDIIDLN